MVDRADDPPAVLADVEDVDAAGRLLESAQEGPLSDEGVTEDRRVDRPVQDEQRRVPDCVGDELVELRKDAVEERADRLPAEKPRLDRDDPAECGGHHRLYFVGGDVADVAALDLPQRVARFRVAAGSDDAGGRPGGAVARPPRPGGGRDAEAPRRRARPPPAPFPPARPPRGARV